MNETIARKTNLFGAWCGIFYLLMLFAGWFLIAGFFPLHHHGEDLAGIEILLRLVEQGARICPQNAGDEPCAHRGSAGITAGRVEGEANDRPAIAHDIGDHRDDRGGHLGKIETGIGDVRFERDRALADVDDTHLELSFDPCCSAEREGRCSRSAFRLDGADGRLAR